MVTQKPYTQMLLLLLSLYFVGCTDLESATTGLSSEVPIEDNVLPDISSPLPPTVLSPLNNSTSDAIAIILSGGCESNSTVLISGDISGTSTATRCVNSVYSRSVNLLTSNGPKIIQLFQRDVAGNSSGSVILTVKLAIVVVPPLDTTAPAAPTITSPSNNSTSTSQSITLTGGCESESNVLVTGDITGSSNTAVCSNSMYSRSLNLTAGNGAKSIQVAQRDIAGNTSTSRSLSVTLSIPVVPPPSSDVVGIDNKLKDCSAYPHTIKHSITNAGEFADIPKSAQAGSLFILEPGIYTMSNIVLSDLQGTANAMITICGQGAVEIRGEGVLSKKRIFTINNSNYVRVANLEISLGMKGLMAEQTNNSIFENLEIHETGHEALHLLNFSKNNIVKNNKIYNTGKEPGAEGIGEGIYIGTAFGKNIEDASDFNTIRQNVVGPGIAAEHVDIKEFTTGGLIENNFFDGQGMKGENSSESWVNVKGNGYLIKNNRGQNSILHGFKQVVRIVGWGDSNRFEGNEGTLNNTKADRLFISIHRESTDAPNNFVDCKTNKILDASSDYLTNAKSCL